MTFENEFEIYVIVAKCEPTLQDEEYTSVRKCVQINVSKFSNNFCQICITVETFFCTEMSIKYGRDIRFTCKTWIWFTAK